VNLISAYQLSSRLHKCEQGCLGLPSYPVINCYKVYSIGADINGDYYDSYVGLTNSYAGVNKSYVGVSKYNVGIDIKGDYYNSYVGVS
jgi:hypothetical protein